MSHNCNFKYGTLASTNPFVVAAAEFYLPATITLTSADAGRKIELTTDGTNWYQPTYDASPATFINVSIKSPIKAFRVTGAVNDTWNSR